MKRLMANGLSTPTCYPNYEAQLVHSLQRYLTNLNVMMARRMANSGYTSVEGHRLDNSYHAVLSHQKASDEVK